MFTIYEVKAYLRPTSFYVRSSVLGVEGGMRDDDEGCQ